MSGLGVPCLWASPVCWGNPGSHAFPWHGNGWAFYSRRLHRLEGNMLRYMIQGVYRRICVSPLGQTELFPTFGYEINFWAGTSHTGTWWCAHSVCHNIPAANTQQRPHGGAGHRALQYDSNVLKFIFPFWVLILSQTLKKKTTHF